MAVDASVPLTSTPSAEGELAPLAVSAHRLTRAFDGRGILHGIDLEIRQGEFVALLGRSGSGKSTLLRILARLDPHFAGDLRVPERPSVAFQDSRLLPWKRVVDNVTLGLADQDADRRAADLLAEVGLADRARAWPKTLSGGEAQRAALARALIRQPELLLMDEPFGALDALTRIRMHRLLRTLCDHYRPGVLLVTHDVDEAVVLADRILVLTDGEVSLDLPIDLPVNGRRHRAEFAQIRDGLLAALGVDDDDR